MTEQTATGPADLTGVLAEVARLEAVAVALDARLDASLADGDAVGIDGDPERAGPYGDPERVGPFGDPERVGPDGEPGRQARLVDLREGALT